MTTNSLKMEIKPDPKMCCILNIFQPVDNVHHYWCVILDTFNEIPGIRFCLRGLLLIFCSRNLKVRVQMGAVDVSRREE
jgi:hypothetical protein